MLLFTTLWFILHNCGLLYDIRVPVCVWRPFVEECRVCLVHCPSGMSWPSVPLHLHCTCVFKWPYSMYVEQLWVGSASLICWHSALDGSADEEFVLWCHLCICTTYKLNNSFCRDVANRLCCTLYQIYRKSGA